MYQQSHCKSPYKFQVSGSISSLRMQVMVTGFWDMALRAWTVGGTGSSARGGRGELSGVLTRVGPRGPSSVGHPFPPAQMWATAHHGIRDGLGLDCWYRYHYS